MRPAPPPVLEPWRAPHSPFSFLDFPLDPPFGFPVRRNLIRQAIVISSRSSPLSLVDGRLSTFVSSAHPWGQNGGGFDGPNVWNLNLGLSARWRAR